MDLVNKLEEAAQGQRKPYINELARNINQALPDAKVLVDNINIYLYLYGEQQSDLKKWLYSFLETLPEINYPIERVCFVIYLDDKMEQAVVINPSENDVRALDNAIHNQLAFSKPADSTWFDPMPLDHPWYQDKDYFRKTDPKSKLKNSNGERSEEAELFNKIKDQPNVKSILDEIRNDGADI